MCHAKQVPQLMPCDSAFVIFVSRNCKFIRLNFIHVFILHVQVITSWRKRCFCNKLHSGKTIVNAKLVAFQLVSDLLAKALLQDIVVDRHRNIPEMQT